MNFWLLKQLREYCRVNEGATALHENPAVLIWKISTSVSVFINPHFFFLFHVLIYMNYIGYVHFQKVWFTWNWVQILTVWVWKTVRFHDNYRKPGSRIGCVLFTFCLFQESCPTTFTPSQTFQNYPPPLPHSPLTQRHLNKPGSWLFS